MRRFPAFSLFYARTNFDTWLGSSWKPIWKRTRSVSHKHKQHVISLFFLLVPFIAKAEGSTQVKIASFFSLFYAVFCTRKKAFSSKNFYREGAADFKKRTTACEKIENAIQKRTHQASYFRYHIDMRIVFNCRPDERKVMFLCHK